MFADRRQEYALLPSILCILRHRQKGESLNMFFFLGIHKKGIIEIRNVANIQVGHVISFHGQQPVKKPQISNPSTSSEKYPWLHRWRWQWSQEYALLLSILTMKRTILTMTVPSYAAWNKMLIDYVKLMLNSNKLKKYIHLFLIRYITYIQRAEQLKCSAVFTM